MSDPRYPGRPGPYAGQQQAGYPPPESELEQTTQLPAFNYRPDPPPVGQPIGLFAGSPVLLWGLRAFGLIAVAVISGLVWYYITNDSTPPPSQQADQQTQQGKYTFVPAAQLPQPVRDSSCVEHSTDEVQAFLRKHHCRGLVRQLYTVTGPDGRTIVASVSAVQMADAGEAKALGTLTSRDGTGNVKDLVRDNKAKVPGLKRLDVHGGYASQQVDTKLIIVEADFTTKATDKDEPVLDDVCQDALRLGPALR